jgi:hypothetical protein
MERKNADSNPVEFIVALLATGSIVNPRDIVDKPDWLICDNFEDYKNNLRALPSCNIYVDNFMRVRQPSWSDYTKVFLPGKKRLNHPILAGADRKTTKADVYLGKEDGTLIGISVKQSTSATKSNYSVEKMLTRGTFCKEERKKYLVEHGFPKHDPTKRKQINDLFKERDTNPYWSAIRQELLSDGHAIKMDLVKYLYSSDSPIELWEFDGTNLNPLCLGLSPDAKVDFEEHEPFYLNADSTPRSAAKLFYKLSVDDHEIKKEYRVEIRFKGNFHTVSPQFQIHAI